MVRSWRPFQYISRFGNSGQIGPIRDVHRRIPDVIQPFLKAHFFAFCFGFVLDISVMSYDTVDDCIIPIVIVGEGHRFYVCEGGLPIFCLADENPP